ncbi:MAG: L-2-hydroxyglutarate oxidase [Patulibacter sp.]|nr:L-2-hydroxyglutarate oxidase [Patulibacter sp.]
MVGGGILGLACAHELRRRHPGLRITVLERESRLAVHQSGSNSGVIHAGVYYAPGSLKARLCRRGAELMFDYCAQHDVPIRRSGKLIVASRSDELPRLDALEQRARANAVPGLRRVDADGIAEIEPHAVGVAALHSPETGVVDFAQVCERLAAELRANGQQVLLGHEVLGVEERSDRLRLRHPGGVVEARWALFCAGAWSDRLAVAAGAPADPRIVPFRGGYLDVVPARRNLVRGLVYPVPDPTLPFLGVHLSRHVDGSLSVGPTALLAGSLRPGRAFRITGRDVARTAGWPGTARMVWRYRRAAATELRHAISRRALRDSAARYVPSLRIGDLTPGPAGIRAQALTRRGELVDDFAFSHTTRAVHVRNAPSPGATASLAIAEHVADVLDGRFAPGR